MFCILRYFELIQFQSTKQRTEAMPANLRRIKVLGMRVKMIVELEGVHQFDVSIYYVIRHL
jgi:hypothetical protein